MRNEQSSGLPSPSGIAKAEFGCVAELAATAVAVADRRN
jgi:hypothetical protein